MGNWREGEKGPKFCEGVFRRPVRGFRDSGGARLDKGVEPGAGADRVFLETVA